MYYFIGCNIFISTFRKCSFYKWLSTVNHQENCSRSTLRCILFLFCFTFKCHLKWKKTACVLNFKGDSAESLLLLFSFWSFYSFFVFIQFFFIYTSAICRTSSPWNNLSLLHFICFFSWRNILCLSQTCLWELEVKRKVFFSFKVPFLF